MEQKQCIYCQDMFMPKRSNSVICGSRACKLKRKKEQSKKNYVKYRDQDGKQGKLDKTKLCAWCNKPFVNPYSKRMRSKFCGEACRTKHNQYKGKLSRERRKRETMNRSAGPVTAKPDLSKGRTLEWWRRMLIFSCHFERQRGRTFTIPEKWQATIDQLKGSE